MDKWEREIIEEALQGAYIYKDDKKYSEALRLVNKAVIDTLTKMATWYRFNSVGITIANLKPVIEIADYFQFKEYKQKEIQEWMDTAGTCLLELTSHGGVDHRMFRGIDLYDGDYFNKWWKRDKVNYEHIMKYDGQAILDYFLEKNNFWKRIIKLRDVYVITRKREMKKKKRELSNG